MDRRHLLASSLAVAAVGRADTPPERQWYELHRYRLSGPGQRAGLEAYFRESAMPALGRLGIEPVGLFTDGAGENDIWALLPHPTAESALSTTDRLLADAAFAGRAAAFLEAPKDDPPYDTLETRLLRAIDAMPSLEPPPVEAGRVLQLRIYESPSTLTGRAKIRMFNEAELAIFRRVGLNPVFFAETIYGAEMPSLTYLLAFESEAAQQAAWRAFGADEEWQRLRQVPEFADGRIIRRITNLSLKPAPGSQL